MIQHSCKINKCTHPPPIANQYFIMYQPIFLWGRGKRELVRERNLIESVYSTFFSTKISVRPLLCIVVTPNQSQVSLLKRKECLVFV